MTVYDFNVTDPEELAETIWALSEEIAKLREKVESLEARIPEEGEK